MVASEGADRLSDAEAVRQPQEVLPATDGPEATKRRADRSKPVIAVLNDRWRVIDDGLEWVLQRRKGRRTPKSTGWCGRSYAASRRSLLDSVEDEEYAFCKPTRNEFKWSRLIEPLAVAGIITGLVFLFFSNQSEE